MSSQLFCFRLCGVDIQSQTAYELAAKGPIRPLDSEIPVIYGIKCVEFNLPDFTIGKMYYCNYFPHHNLSEIHCINEYEMYLKALIHEIGIKMNSTAHCTALQCLRQSCFTLDHALLRKHWVLEHILTNIEECSKLLKDHQYISKQDSAVLVSSV